MSRYSTRTVVWHQARLAALRGFLEDEGCLETENSKCPHTTPDRARPRVGGESSANRRNQACTALRAYNSRTRTHTVVYSSHIKVPTRTVRDHRISMTAYCFKICFRPPIRHHSMLIPYNFNQYIHITHHRDNAFDRPRDHR